MLRRCNTTNKLRCGRLKITDKKRIQCWKILLIRFEIKRNLYMYWIRLYWPIHLPNKINFQILNILRHYYTFLDLITLLYQSTYDRHSFSLKRNFHFTYNRCIKSNWLKIVFLYICVRFYINLWHTSESESNKRCFHNMCNGNLISGKCRYLSIVL